MSARSNSGLAGTSQPLFLFCLGIFAILHWAIYFFWWPMPATWATHAIGIFGFCLALRPTYRIFLISLMLAMAIDGYLQAPVLSNHTILKNFVVLGFFTSCAEGLLRRWHWNDIVRRFATYAAIALLGMYFFGIFHKINYDFLNPEVSCAVSLLKMMPLPQFLLDSRVLHQFAIYGTFFIEGVIFLLLIMPRFRFQGIIFGMAFHMLLALSAYEYYTTFSALTIALHTLFLPSNIQRQLVPHFWPSLIGAPSALSRSHLAALMLALWIALVAFLSWLGDVVAVAVVWLLISIPLLIAITVVLRRQKPKKHQALHDTFLLQPSFFPILFFVIFMFNGFSPYLGLKTAQSFNMFANLQLERGQSNHLIMAWPPAPFGYLDQVVQVDAVAGSAYLEQIQREGLYLTYYSFLDQVERSVEGLRVSYKLNDQLFEDRSREDLADEIKRTLHSRLVRKWFHFAPVDLDQPKICAPNR